MERYFSICLICIKRSLVKELMMKANLLVRALTGVIYLGIYLLFFNVLYTSINGIGDWTKSDIYILVGTFHIIHNLMLAFFLPNLSVLPWLIKQGQLDYLLLKPVNTQFLVSISDIDYSALVNVIVGGGIVFATIHNSAYTIGFLMVLKYVILLITSTLLLYNVLYLFVLTAFWLDDATWCINSYLSLTNFMDKPASIFKGIGGRILQFLIPLLLVSNVPAEVLVGRRDVTLQIFLLIFTFCLSKLVQSIWDKGLENYEGAN